MEDSVDGPKIRRTLSARVGVSALNLIVPGLGLLRLGNWREATFFFLVPFALFILVTFGMGHFPIASYGRALFALIVLLTLWAALYGIPIVLTWRGSRFRSPVRGWSRWYTLMAVVVAMVSLSTFAAPLAHRFYKPFYAPSESMAPTIGKDDKFIADMMWRGPLKRGEIILFQGAYGVRVSRIAALPGDRIAMRASVPIVNGEAAVQSADRRTLFSGYDGSHVAELRTERLPGEASTHRVLETGPAEFDNMREAVVPAQHFFVLGDNRDRSADSRVPPELGGVGMVPSNAIIGRPMYIYWSSEHAKVGSRLDS